MAMKIAAETATTKDFWCRVDIRSLSFECAGLAQVAGTESRAIGWLFIEK
jgi:hypothetical protein